jgi:hypothetical protein
LEIHNLDVVHHAALNFSQMVYYLSQNESDALFLEGISKTLAPDAVCSAFHLFSPVSSFPEFYAYSPSSCSLAEFHTDQSSSFQKNNIHTRAGLSKLGIEMTSHRINLKVE